ncbi:MAG: hypothetical protein ABIM98_04300 [candidate division WOR-3 bacterium]
MIVFWQDEKLPLNKNFFGPKPVRFLEIGFGKGDFLIHLFALDPLSPLVGIEISKKMIKTLLKKLSYHPNIFLFYGDAKFLLKYVFPNFLFEKIFMLFPFTFKKEKHKERRIYENDFPEIIWYSLKEEGKFYSITDEKFFYEEMKEKFLRKGYFIEDEFEDFFLEKATDTKYARKWKKIGKKFYFLSLKKVSDKKPDLEKKIKIINKFDHLILEKEDFENNYERKEKERIFKLKRIFTSDKSKIFEFFSKEENFEQFLFFLMEKKDKILLKPLFKEKMIFTEWILDNLKNVFFLKPQN